MASRTEPGASSTQHSLFIKRPSTTTPTNYARLGSLTVRWCTRFDHKSSACNPRSRFGSFARKTVAVRLGGSGRRRPAVVFSSSYDKLLLLLLMLLLQSKETTLGRKVPSSRSDTVCTGKTTNQRAIENKQTRRCWIGV